MPRSIELAESVVAELDKLDEGERLRILKFLEESLPKLTDSPMRGGGLPDASRIGKFWKCIVGDYQLICKVEEQRVIVLTLRRLTES